MKNNRYSITSVIMRVAGKNCLLSAGLLSAVAGAVVFTLVPPLVLENIINRLTQGGNIALSLAVLYFIVLAVSEIFDVLKESLITVFGQKITHAVRSDMCGKLSRLPAAYYADTDPGVTVSRFVGDVDTVETLFSSGVVGMFVDVCKITSVLAVIFLKSKGLGILMLVITPILFLFTRAVRRKMLSAHKSNRVSVGKLNGFIPETIKNIRTVHVFRREKYMEEKYDKNVEDSYRAKDRVNFYDAIYSPVILIVSAVIVAVMMSLASTGGALQSFFGMSVGTAVAVIALVSKVFGPIENIGMEIQTVQSAVAGITRIREFMEQPERTPRGNAVNVGNLVSCGKPAVSADNIVFSYDGETLVIDHLSFTVERGEKVTLIGRTGAGKSTMFKLILGLYLPLQGSVRIFDREASSLPDSSLRRLFGYVEQTFRPVPGSIADQICVFDESISREDVEKAARLSGIHDAVITLPMGYDTEYSDSLFSQGQRQLLAIARAVASDPEILLLDEITANLDSKTEERVLCALEKASAKRTVLSISHRFYEHSGGRTISL